MNLVSRATAAVSIMTHNQDSGSLYTPSTLEQPTVDPPVTQTIEPDSISASFNPEAVPVKRGRGRPKGSTTKKRSLPEDGEHADPPKRPRGRPRKSETSQSLNIPRRPGRPRKQSDATSADPMTEANVSIVPTPQMQSKNGEPSTTKERPDFRRSSSAFRTVQNFSLGFDNALGRWDVEQLVLNMSRPSSGGQLTVKGSIRLGFRAQELSREEHENLGQILKAPPLQNGEQLNISFTGEATSH